MKTARRHLRTAVTSSASKARGPNTAGSVLQSQGPSQNHPPAPWAPWA